MIFTMAQPLTVDTLFARTKELLREQGCEEYISVGWHRGTRHLGIAHEWGGRPYRITYSRRAMESLSRAQIFDTMTHEVAHVLVGVGKHKHDAVWRAKHRELGGSGERVTTLSDEEGARMYKWVGQCQSCPKMYFRARMTTKTRLYACCNRCRSAINWTQNW